MRDLMAKAQFEYVIPITKAQGLESEPNEDGDWIVSGIVTGPGFVDAENHEFLPDAINRMVARITPETPVPLKDWHARNTLLAEEMGEVFKAWVNDEGQLGIDARLDKDHPTAVWLRKKIQKGKQFGFSVGGEVTAKKSVEKAGRQVLQFLDVIPSEFSLTTKPFYQPSFGTVITKAIDEAQAESVDKGEQSSMSDKEVTPKAGEEKVETVTEVEVPTIDGDPTTEGLDPVKLPVPPDDMQATPLNQPELEKVEKSELVKELVKLLVPALRAELGNSSTGEAAPTAADSQPTEAQVEKSQDAPDDRLILLEKALRETREEVELLKESVPEVNAPGVLVQKSEVDAMMETVKTLSPSERLRFGLRAKHKE